MYGYTIKIKQISGKINENKIPKKSLIIKSKKMISENAAFEVASEYLKKKYNLTLESARVINEGFMDKMKGLFGKKKEEKQEVITPPTFPDLSGILSNPSYNTESSIKYWKEISRSLKFAGVDESDIKIMKNYCTGLQVALREFIRGSKTLFEYLTEILEEDNEWTADKCIDWSLSQYVFGSSKNSGDGKLFKNEVKDLIKLAKKTVNVSNKCINLTKSKNKTSKMVTDSYSPNEINRFKQYGENLINYLEKKGASDSIAKLERVIDIISGAMRLLMEMENYIYHMENKNSNRFNEDMIRDIESWLNGEY